MNEENIATVEKYLDALRQKDLSLAPFDHDLKFSDPLAGEGSSADSFRAFLSGFLPGISGVRVIRHVADAEHVATHWEVTGVFGPIPIIQIFRVRDGMIIESTALYDPRPAIGS